jgi:hypothetical protein
MKKINLIRKKKYFLQKKFSFDLEGKFAKKNHNKKKINFLIKQKIN